MGYDELLYELAYPQRPHNNVGTNHPDITHMDYPAGIFFLTLLLFPIRWKNSNFSLILSTSSWEAQHMGCIGINGKHTNANRKGSTESNNRM